MSKYNKEFQAVIDANYLPNTEGYRFIQQHLGTTYINISGKACKVVVSRTESGNIEISPVDKGINDEGGWLYDGTCTEGCNEEVIITKFTQ